MRNMKRIHKVVIKRMYDESPDTSWLGEYGSRAESDYSIDREHDEDCPRFWANDDIPDDARDCNCSGSRDRNSYQYFNPGSVEPFKAESHWTPTGVQMTQRRDYWQKDMKENARKDYARMEALNRGDFCFIGIRAEADYSTGGQVSPVQTISSGGLWGIESDSEPAYLAEIEQEQLAELKAELKAIGFSSRAIATAFKTVEYTGDAR